MSYSPEKTSSSYQVEGRCRGSGLPRPGLCAGSTPSVYTRGIMYYTGAQIATGLEGCEY